MTDARPVGSTEPSSALRIARACPAPDCGAVFYVAAIIDDAVCPSCSPTRDRYELSA